MTTASANATTRNKQPLKPSAIKHTVVTDAVNAASRIAVCTSSYNLNRS